MENPYLLMMTLAVLGELIIEGLKPGLEPWFVRWGVPADVNPYLYLSLALGVLLALVYRVDVLAIAGLAPPTWVGMVTTGLLTGRGANVVHDVVALISGRWTADGGPRKRPETALRKATGDGLTQSDGRPETAEQ